jgi:hypothetical protein
MPNAPWSTLDLSKLQSEPHDDGIVSSSQTKAVDIVSNEMQQLSIQKTAVGLAPDSTTPTTQSLDVHNVKLKTQRFLNSPKRRRKERERRVVGAMIKGLIRMLRGGKMKRER